MSLWQLGQYSKWSITESVTNCQKYLREQLSPRKTPSWWGVENKTGEICDLLPMPMAPNGSAELFYTIGWRISRQCWYDCQKTHPNLRSYAYIPVMQTSEYRNRDEFAWAWNFWLFRLWNRCVTICFPWILRSVTSESVGHVGRVERTAHQGYYSTTSLLANLFPVEYYILLHGVTWQPKQLSNDGGKKWET